MKKLLILFLILLLFFFALVIPAFASNDVEDVNIIFHASERGVCAEILIISWQDGIIDIKYGDNITKTKAAEEFFEFLREYIEEGYEIIPKKGGGK